MVARRKSKALPLPSKCPIGQCMRLLGRAWTAHVMWYLREGERCFTELQHDLQGVSSKMLASRLRELECNGVVERFTKPTSPPTVWYSLTPVGMELCTALINVVEVAQRLDCSHAASSAAAV